MNLSPLFSSRKINLIWEENGNANLIDHPNYGMISPNAFRAMFANTSCPHCSKMAEIEGSCDEVQPVAETSFPYTFQRLNFPDRLNPIFRPINKFSKYISFEAFDR